MSCNNCDESVDGGPSASCAGQCEEERIREYQRLVDGGPCGMMERPSEEANGCGKVFDKEKCKECQFYPQPSASSPSEYNPAEAPDAENRPDASDHWPRIQDEPEWKAVQAAPSEEEPVESFDDLLRDVIDYAEGGKVPESWMTRDLTRLRAALADREKEREALEDIASQHIGDEIDPEVREYADYQGAYEAIVKIARAALAKEPAHE